MSRLYADNSELELKKNKEDIITSAKVAVAAKMCRKMTPGAPIEFMDNGEHNSGMHCTGTVFENYNEHDISLDVYHNNGVERKNVDPVKATNDGWLWLNCAVTEELSSSSSPRTGAANGLVQSTQ